MSTQVVNSLSHMNAPSVRDSDSANFRGFCGPGAFVAFAPAIAAAAALSMHHLLPNGQGDFPTRLYPFLLQITLGLALLVPLLQWTVGALRECVRHYSPLAAGAIALAAIWDLITLKMAWMPMPYFPGPDAVLQGIVEDYEILLDSTYLSLRLLLTGYVLGGLLGVFTGVMIGWFRGVRYWGMPIMKVIGPIPATALVPLAMVLFESSFMSGVSLIALAVWFPVTMLTNSGIANVPKSYFDVARTLGAGRWYLIFHVAIPAALPSIFIGLFMGLGASFLTLIVAETVGVRNGLGWYLKWQQGYAEYAKVYGVLIIMSFFFSGIMTLLFKIRDRVLGWQKGMIRW